MAAKMASTASAVTSASSPAKARRLHPVPFKHLRQCLHRRDEEDAQDAVWRRSGEHFHSGIASLLGVSAVSPDATPSIRSTRSSTS